MPKQLRKQEGKREGERDREREEQRKETQRGRGNADKNFPTNMMIMHYLW